MAQQVGREHRVGAGEIGDQLRPGRRGVADGVDEHEHRPLACQAVGTPIAVHDTVVRPEFAVADGAQARGVPCAPALDVHGPPPLTRAAAKAAETPALQRRDLVSQGISRRFLLR